MNDSEMPRSEKTRICPSCRCQISVLATKCRFCGEEVGKPKEEARTLSIHDLGGEQVYHRAPSGSVLEAMESFRAEESMSKMSDSGGASSLKDLGFGEADGEQGGTGIAFDDEPSPAFSASRDQSGSGGLAGRVKLAGAVIAVLALLVAGATLGPRVLGSLGASEADAELPTYVNRAPQILGSGGPPIEALASAVEAIDREDSAKNRRIAEDAVAAIEKQVDSLLKATPFDQENLQQASSITTRAASLYPNQTTRNLADEVREENRSYAMSLREIDRETGTASFGLLNEPGWPIVKAKEGDMLQDRFRVRSIVRSRTAGKVILVDTKRGNRPVAYGIATPPMPVE